MKTAEGITLRPVGDSYILDVVGEIDISNIEYFNVLLANCADRPVDGAVIISLAHTTYFDSQLIHAVIGAIDLFRLHKKTLLLVTPASESGRRVIELVGFGKLLPVFETLDDALGFMKGEKPSSLDGLHFLYDQRSAEGISHEQARDPANDRRA